MAKIFQWIVPEVRFFRVGGSALIFSSDITMCWKFPALKHLLLLVPVNICGHRVSGQSNQLLSFVMMLTHCGLVMSYSIIDLGQHWLVTWWHWAITWTSIDLSSARSCSSHLRQFHKSCLICPLYEFGNYKFNIAAASPRDQWVDIFGVTDTILDTVWQWYR